MTLALCPHPLASCCRKVPIARHGNGSGLEPHAPTLPFAAAIPARFRTPIAEAG